MARALHFMLTAVSLKRLVYTKKRFNPFRETQMWLIRIVQRQVKESRD